MGIIVGIVLIWIMWVTIEGELIDEGVIKPKKPKKPRNDLRHLFEEETDNDDLTDGLRKQEHRDRLKQRRNKNGNGN